MKLFFYLLEQAYYSVLVVLFVAIFRHKFYDEVYDFSYYIFLFVLFFIVHISCRLRKLDI